MTSPGNSAPALPKLLVGQRRKLMALLVGTGLLAVAGGIGAGRVTERVLAERLGQSYIQELRRGLMTAVLAKRDGPSVGITIARGTNDLSSVRNWVSMAVAP